MISMGGHDEYHAWVRLYRASVFRKLGAYEPFPSPFLAGFNLLLLPCAQRNCSAAAVAVLQLVLVSNKGIKPEFSIYIINNNGKIAKVRKVARNFRI